ncbi:SWIM zinc finger family protein [Anaerotalea alkaliphila]|uniref:SWIM-type domain-containing protein n=1 Tax=Anaerotalea alkaliphila TaxID=2662126 RepID=A0A7X5HW86_9FIRM|nr:SWIM zinc finger family protein [Anaerotalea alkaliphila]NDL67800.1 hypothetical protein [Anaerotalea alkaliphila]
MHLNDFEKHIDPRILERGRDYYTSGAVLDLEEMEENSYEAEVEGTDLYTVWVDLDGDGEILETACDCPYEMGEYCKHQVAVFLALRNLREGPARHSPAPKGMEKAKGKEPPAIRDLLAARTKEELAAFLEELAAEQPEVRKRLRWDFQEVDPKEERDQAVALIQSYIRKNTDRYGQIPYGKTEDAVEGVHLVLAKARQALRRNQILQGVELALLAVREMVDLLRECEDPDGGQEEELETALYECLDCIREAVGGMEEEQEPPPVLEPALQEALFTRLLEESKGSRYGTGAGWNLEFLELCAPLAAGRPDLRKVLEDRLDVLLQGLDRPDRDSRDKWEQNREVESLLLFRYRLVEEFDGWEKAKEFLAENVLFPEFRKRAIALAIGQKDYPEVIRLAREGEGQDQKWRGQVDQWRRLRHQAAKLGGLLEEERSAARELALDGSMEHYRELKATYEPEAWKAEYPRILRELEGERWKEGSYRDILLEEGEKARLLEHIQARPWLVEDYWSHLLPDHQEEVFLLFHRKVLGEAAGASDRKAYQRVCATLRNLKKAGGEALAEETKQKLLLQYPNKRALRDELSRT